jgi:hypothetical protein
MRRVFRRIKPRDLIPIMGAATVEDILSKLREAGVVVIDMGGVLAEAKLGFFLALAKHLYGLMESGVNLDIALVIDEAPLDAGGEGGASEWLSPYGITADRLLLLKPGRFYFTGAMNPSPVPLLITYSPPSGV